MCTYYYTVSKGVDSFTAGVKAPGDMCEIMRRRGYHPLYLYEYIRGEINLQAKLKKMFSWLGIVKKVKRHSCVVMQYPYNLTTMAEPFIRFLQKWKHVRFVFILHDIDSIRAYNVNFAEQREKILPEIDYLICHNEAMKSYLIYKGIRREKIYSLGIFDYLHNFKLSDLKHVDEGERTVIVAGNLNVRKSPYLGDLLRSKRDYVINLYGPSFEPASDYDNYTYFGQIDPGELPSKLEGAFGLVWDGDSLETCGGATGKYLRYNNPHKASLYISSCIPVIVWDQSAIAEYVEKNGLGIVVSSIKNIDKEINSIDAERYNTIKQNVKKEAEKLTRGWYLNNVLNQIENRG